MKKFIYVLAVILMSSNVHAGIRSIVDWDGGSNPYKPGDVSVTGENLKTKCSEACPGYDLKIARCPTQHKLIHCSIHGCGYYNKCIPLSSEEESNYQSNPLDDIDVDEIYNQILEEQKSEKELRDSINDIRSNL